MADIFQRVAENIRRRRLLTRGETVVVAVSGGVDSMVLFHVLSRLAPRQEWRLIVAHADHGWRGEESAHDREFVEQTSMRAGWPCVSTRLSIRRRKGESPEMAARRLRHGFLAGVAAQHGCRRMALGHQADDQVEQFFLRLCRGGGAQALAGLRWAGPSPVNSTVELVRPLLNVTREELLTLAEQEGWAFRIDATNASTDILRNRIRHELLPLLRRDFQPGLNQVVGQSMDLLSEAWAYLAEEAARWRQNGEGRPSFDELAMALQREILHGQLVAAGVEPSFALVEQLRSQASLPVEVAPGKRIARDDHARLHWVGPAPKLNRVLEPDHKVISLRQNQGQCGFAGVRLRWRRVAGRWDGRLPRPQAGEEVFDAAKIGRSIRLRTWRPGDRFQPVGLPRPAKLQDMFVNLKIPRAQRHALLVGEVADGRIFWVEGLRIGEQFKLDNSTARQLKWHWRRARASQSRLRAEGHNATLPAQIGSNG